MRKTSVPVACPNATRSPMLFSCRSCAFHCFRSDCNPRICARNSSDSPGVDALPSSVCRLRTSSTRSTKCTPSWCLFTLLIASTPFFFFLVSSNAGGECSSWLLPGLGVDFVETSHTLHCSSACGHCVHRPIRHSRVRHAKVETYLTLAPRTSVV